MTGATGFFCTFLLRALLVRGLNVVALVRGADGRARLLEALKLFVGSADCATPGNLDVVQGDLEQEHFGLSPDDFSALARRCDAIVHNGCRVTGVLSYGVLRAANVSSTLTCLRLAHAGCRRLLYISSLSALTSGEPHEVPLAQDAKG